MQLLLLLSVARKTSTQWLTRITTVVPLTHLTLERGSLRTREAAESLGTGSGDASFLTRVPGGAGCWQGDRHMASHIWLFSFLRSRWLGSKRKPLKKKIPEGNGTPLTTSLWNHSVSPLPQSAAEETEGGRGYGGQPVSQGKSTRLYLRVGSKECHGMAGSAQACF